MIVSVADQGVGGDAHVIATVLDLVYGDDFEPTMALDEIDVIAAHVTPEGMAILESLDVVESVSVARRFELSLDVSVPQVGASVLHTSGLTGVGKAVAVIDSGIQSDHPGLVDSVVAEACFTNGAESATVPGTLIPMPYQELCRNGSVQQVDVDGAGLPCTLVPDDCSHGTSVAGIIRGADPVYTGVAPAAGLISIRVTAVVKHPDSGNVGYIPEQGVLNALNHVLTLSSSFDIASVNLSLGAPAGTCQSTAWESVVSELGDAGIAVVAASGNGSSSTAISFPACLPAVVSVGSSNAAGEVSSFTDSSHLLDLLAPGEPVVTAVPTSFWPLDYLPLQGTSFAAPHVAAAYALLDSTFPTFGVDRLRNLLRSTAVMIPRADPDPSGRIPRFPELRLDVAAGFVPFADATGAAFWVAPSDWAKATGVSTGIDGVNFGPFGTLTRAQAVTFLWRFMGRPAAATKATFSDVVVGSFYELAVDWAAAEGVTTGIGGNLFDPNGAVTRSQLATFMWRMVGHPTGSASSGFVDVVPGSFYVVAVDWMAHNNITTGTTATTFSPEQVVDRAQMVTFLLRSASTGSAWTGTVAPPSLALF